MSATHKGAIGHVVSAPAGTQFMRIVKVVDKSKRCSVCGGPSKNGDRSKRRWSADRLDAAFAVQVLAVGCDNVGIRTTLRHANRVI